MRIQVQVEDRVGITHKVLGVLADRQIDLAAVESEGQPESGGRLHFIYIDAPDVDEHEFYMLKGLLLRLDGIYAVDNIALMPSEQREIHLNTLLAAIPEPVIVIDHAGAVIFKNNQADRIAGGISVGQSIEGLFDHRYSTAALLAPEGAHEHMEVLLQGVSYLVESLPIATDEGDLLGAFLRLELPTQVGERLSSWQARETHGFADIIGDCALMKQVKAQAQRIAQLDLPVLITGETGTGKELFARALHEAGPRSTSPFLALNCASLPESLAESELFGYAPGAFSGASKGGKPGLLELADKGTVFLDEIGEMTPYLQAKLLRFVQDGTFHRVGGKKERKVDVRIVSATHRDLKAMVGQGAFREDLWYRLNVLSLELPSLSERAEDIPALLNHFMATACRRIDRECARLTEVAVGHLQAVSWPGNIRQLENCVFRLVSMTDGPVIDLEQVQAIVGGVEAGPAAAPDSWAQAVERFERDLLEGLYPKYPSCRKLARRLQVSHTSIADKLRKYRISQ